MSVQKPDMTIAWSVGGVIVKPADSKITGGWIAEKPPFQTMNWQQNRGDEFLQHLNVEGVPKWDALTNYDNDSIVKASDGLTYTSNQNNNKNNNPVGGPAGRWSKNVTRLTQMIDFIFPVGHVLYTANPNNPATYYGVGTWVQLEGRFIVGQEDGDIFANEGALGGDRNLSLLAHNHGGKTVNGDPHGHKYARSNYANDNSGSLSLGIDGIIQLLDTEDEQGHEHGIESNGGSGVDKNLPPFNVKYIWERIN